MSPDASTIARPPGPGSAALRGNRRAFLDNPAEYLLELQREYGDLVYFRLGLRDNYLVSHPDDIKDVLTTHHHRFHKGPAMRDGLRMVGKNLFTIEGETHRRHRRLIQPAFHWERLKTYVSIMVEESVKVSESFRDGQTRDISLDMAHLTLGVAVRALFGTDLSEGTRRRITEYVRVLLAPWFNRSAARQATFASRGYRETLARADAIVDEMILERRRRSSERTDLLSMLLQAQDEDGSRFTDREVRDEIAALIVAGHETTSAGLTWAWYLLSQNPESEGRLHRHLAELGGRLPTLNDVESLGYVEMVMSESLRMLPTVWGFDRTVVEEHEIRGYRVPVGSVVFVSPFVVHRDHRWFPEPDRFDPDRWTDDLKRTRPRYAYFPFGGGLRMCVGQPFALMEATIVLAVIAQRWRMRLEPGHPVELTGGVTLRPRHGMRMVVERHT